MSKISGIDKLRRFLVHPENRGRVIQVLEMCRAIGQSREWFYKCIGKNRFAQEWFAVNHDSPIDVKAYYQEMLMTGVRASKKEQKISITGLDGIVEDRKEFYVPVEVAKEIVTSRIVNHRQKVAESGAGGSVTMITHELAFQKVDEQKLLLHQIKERFVLAEVGTEPKIQNIMTEMGLLDANGKETGPLTLLEVRKHSVAAKWLQSRDDHIRMISEYSQVEADQIAKARLAEMTRLLFEQGKLIVRDSRQFRKEGIVTNQDRTREIPYTFDEIRVTGVLTSVTETLRRLTESGRSGDGRKTVDLSTQLQDGDFDESREIFAKLVKMTREEKMADVAHWLQIEKSLNNTGKTGLTWQELLRQEGEDETFNLPKPCVRIPD